jgi:hypothetical protein
VMDGGGLWEFLMTGRDGIICMYNRCEPFAPTLVV